MAIETFLSSSASPWTCPAGVTSVQVECWGGGGAGYETTTSYPGAGSGGAYSKKNSLIVVPGNTYTYVVGGQSTDTYFKSTSDVLAKAGVNGVYQGTVSGGQASDGVGDVKYSGGSGGYQNFDGWGGGSSAGTAANGNSASGIPGATAPTGGGNGGRGFNGSTNAGAGVQPGGGGGSSYNNNPAGAGATGKIVLTYIIESTFTPTVMMF